MPTVRLERKIGQLPARVLGEIKQALVYALEIES